MTSTYDLQHPAAAWLESVTHRARRAQPLFEIAPKGLAALASALPARGWSVHLEADAERIRLRLLRKFSEIVVAPFVEAEAEAFAVRVDDGEAFLRLLKTLAGRRAPPLRFTFVAQHDALRVSEHPHRYGEEDRPEGVFELGARRALLQPERLEGVQPRRTEAVRALKLAAALKAALRFTVDSRTGGGVRHAGAVAGPKAKPVVRISGGLVSAGRRPKCFVEALSLLGVEATLTREDAQIAVRLLEGLTRPGQPIEWLDYGDTQQLWTEDFSFTFPHPPIAPDEGPSLMDLSPEAEWEVEGRALKQAIAKLDLLDTPRQGAGAALCVDHGRVSLSSIAATGYAACRLPFNLLSGEARVPNPDGRVVLRLGDLRKAAEALDDESVVFSVQACARSGRQYLLLSGTARELTQHFVLAPS